MAVNKQVWKLCKIFGIAIVAAALYIIVEVVRDAVGVNRAVWIGVAIWMMDMYIIWILLYRIEWRHKKGDEEDEV